MKHFDIYRKLVLITGAVISVLSVLMVFFARSSPVTMLWGFSGVLILFALLLLLDFLHNRYNDDLLEQITLLIESLVEQQERQIFSEAEDTLTARLQHQLLKLRNILTAQNQMLAQEKEQIKTLISDISHQIKTPIAAMRLLLEDRADGTGLLAGQQAAEELFKIEQYAEMALCYARLDSLSSDLLFKKYNVYGILKQAVKKYAVLFIGSGFSFSMEEFAVQAVTDEKWLAFVLEQILSNAIKYTKKGGISIYGADCAGDRQEGEVSYLVIEDSGIGIRKEDLPRIFERGFTGCNGRLEKRSTGIGLYLSRQILDRLSHTIRVESEVGKGTKVILGFVQSKYD